ncbi:MAG TPA: hypothetical protein VJO13_18040 [Ktedonobacterales bacterium]|nr:hypothetical protein [Ktedonobacterales bacterium]
MPENYEVIYTHPSGATATFIRQDGELDALAKGLDAGQFWVFKNVKALLVRNDQGDLEESNRLMAGIGFTALVREIVAPMPVEVAPQPVYAGAIEEQHTGPHLPHPSYWPLLLSIAALITFSGFLVLPTTLLVTGVGLVLVFICMVGFGLEQL